MIRGMEFFQNYCMVKLGIEEKLIILSKLWIAFVIHTAKHHPVPNMLNAGFPDFRKILAHAERAHKEHLRASSCLR